MQRKEKRPEQTPEPIPCLSPIPFEAPQRSHGPTGRSIRSALLNEKKRRERSTTADVLTRENQLGFSLLRAPKLGSVGS